MKRDGSRTSAWQSAKGIYNSSLPESNVQYDVIIIGGGITGATTALQLQQAGKSCILVEAVNAGFGTTGGTTAHLNTFYDTPFYKISKDFGEQNAMLIAQGAKIALELIKDNIASYQIDCSLEEKDAYLFSFTEEQDKELEQIVASAKKAGVPMDFYNKNPFPIPYSNVVRVPDQAQFNPIQYLFGLLKAFGEAGGKLVENCRVTEIKKGEVLEIQTSLGLINAKAAIYATHIPPGVNLLHFRCAPYRSYVLAIRLKHEDYPLAMGYDLNDPYHYYRTQMIDDQNYLIVGGEDHKTGHEENTEGCFRKLESHANTFFRVEEVAFRWSSQYFEPADGLPYIGNLPGHGDNVYVATGLGGNGMIYGTLAGHILSQILVKGENAFQKLLDPRRIKPIAGFANFLKEGADVVKELAGGIFPPDKLKEFSAIAAGEAKIVKYEGHVMGIYKDEMGKLHAINPVCPHIKCSVSWNSAEKSWDCPCHGSRFSFDGTLLTAPAVADLQKVDLVEAARH